MNHHTMTVGELKAKLAKIQDDEMPVCMRVRCGPFEEIELEDGDDLMGDLRAAAIEYGYGSAPPVLMLDGDREPSEMDADE